MQHGDGSSMQRAAIRSSTLARVAQHLTRHFVRGPWNELQLAVFEAQQQARAHGGSSDKSGPSIQVSFFDEKDGSEKTVAVPLGQSLLEAAHENEIDLEGACEGSLACSTCHVVVTDPVLFDKLPEPEDDENDMLDLAYGLTETSRLGCQIIAAPELEGMKVRIPGATRNFAVDGYRPKPH